MKTKSMVTDAHSRHAELCKCGDNLRNIAQICQTKPHDCINDELRQQTAVAHKWVKYAVMGRNLKEKAREEQERFIYRCALDEATEIVDIFQRVVVDSKNTAAELDDIMTVLYNLWEKGKVSSEEARKIGNFGMRLAEVVE